MKTAKKILTFVLALSLVLGSYSVPASAAKAKKAVKSVTVTNVKKGKLTMTAGKTFKIKVKVKVKGGASKKVTYSTSSKKIATVSSKGVIKAKKAGNAKITVKSKFNKKKKAIIKLTVKKKKSTKKPTTTTEAPKKDDGKKDDGKKDDGKKDDGKKDDGKKDDGKKTPEEIQKEIDESSKAALDKLHSGYNLDWKDDFDGTELNRNDWNVELHPKGWVNAELQEYVDSTDNIIVKDGKLTLKPIKTGEGTYTSGRVNTQNKHTYTYGMFEIKAKVPAGMGYLPAFWLMPNNENLYGQWPRCGEIDCMEVMGQEPDKLYGTVHYGDPHMQNQGTYKNGVDFSAAYHTYSFEWDPGKLTWYIDGIKYYETSNWFTTTEGQGTVAYPAPFDQPFYMILNLAVGGSWVGYPNAETDKDMVNQAFTIDYVRAYQRVDKETAYDDSKVEPPVNTFDERDPDANGNFVINGDFANPEDLTDDADWKFLEALGGEATATIANGKMNIATTNEGTVDYSVQLVQAGIPLENGYTYNVSFDAYADSARSMNCAVKAPDRGYVAYMSENVDLTTESQKYSFDFDMRAASDQNGRIEYNMGATGSTAGIHIDNVTIKKSPVPCAPEAKSVRADGNSIYNGKFQEGRATKDDTFINYMQYWNITNTCEAKASVSGINDGRRFIVEVPDDVTGSDAFVLSQNEIPVATGKDYVFSFEAESDVEKDITVNFDGENFTFHLQPGPNKLVKNINIPAQEAKSIYLDKIEFLLGVPGTIKLDNVRLEESALIKNGNFSADLSGFSPYVDSTAAASYTVDKQIEDNAFDITIDKTGDADWKIQLKQDSVHLKEGHWYTLAFKIKSSIDRDISYAIQRDGATHKDAGGNEDWTPYVNDIVSLPAYNTGAAAADQYTVVKNTFRMEYDDDTGSIFNIALGAVSGTQINTQHRVCVDDITLVDLTADKGMGDADFIKSCGSNLLPELSAGKWNPFVDASAAAIFNYGDDDGEKYVTANVTNPGNADWNVQLGTKNLVLEKGANYLLKFDVSSSVARQVKADIMSTEYNWYGGKTFDVTDEKKTIEIPFTMKNFTDIDALLQISFGKIGDNTPAAEVKVSNVSLVKLPPEVN